MRTHRTRLSRRMTAREADQLIAGAPVAADRRALARLLAAASAPARPAELTGEPGAVDGFQRLYREVPHRRPTRRRGLAPLCRGYLAALRARHAPADPAPPLRAPRRRR